MSQHNCFDCNGYTNDDDFGGYCGGCGEYFCEDCLYKDRKHCEDCYNKKDEKEDEIY